MMVLGMLAWLAAAVSLWLGARRYEAAVARGYRWLAAGAALYCSGLVVQGILGVTLNPAPGLSFTDLPPLLALAAVAIGIARRAVLLRPGRAGDPRSNPEPGPRAVLHRPAAVARPSRRGHRHRRAQHGRTRSHPAGGFGGFGTARARRRLRDGRRPAGDRLVHAVQRRVPPVRRTAGHVPARAHPPAGRPGRARRAAAHGHHGLAAGRAALPVPDRYRRRRRAGRGPAGARRPPGRHGPADAGGGGAAARRGAVADDRRVRHELDPPDVEFGGGDRHRGAGRLRGHPGGDSQRPGRRARGRDRADRG